MLDVIYKENVAFVYEYCFIQIVVNEEQTKKKSVCAGPFPTRYCHSVHLGGVVY